MAEKQGIFIRSDRDAVLIIRGCEELLKRIDSDSSCIKILKAVDNPKGFSINFKNYSPIPVFLKERFLPLTDEMATIHTLTTKLTVHSIEPESEDCIREYLHSQLGKLGNILSISSIPAAKEYPTIPSGDWLVEINVPEILEMDVFKKNGLPDRMNIKWPFENDFAKKRVTFFCSVCEDREHPREHCPLLEGSRTDRYRSCVEDESTATFPLPARTLPNFESRDRTQSNSLKHGSDKKYRIEAIVGGLEKKKTQIQFKQQMYDHRRSTEVKQEPEDESYTSGPSTSSKRSLNANEDGNIAKKFRFASILPSRFSNDQGRPEDYSTATSTSGRETPEILYDSAERTPEEHKEPENFENKAFNYHEDASFPNLPTSSQPENIYENSSNNSAMQDASDCSDSNDNSKPLRGTRKKPTYAPVVLPDRIKQIVLERGVREGELNVSQLEAFFNHVKKKMSPAKIARQFTNDVQCLHDQLKAIVQQFYMTPKAASGEDSRFMKWLQGMLERFDSVPSKRKKIKPEH